MSETAIRADAIQAERPKDADLHGEPRKPATTQPSNIITMALKGLASLRLTCVLFVFSILIVFFGTLAQVELGIWNAVETYFRSFFVMIPLQIFAPLLTTFLGYSPGVTLPGSFPFPGGWAIGTALLVNLLAAHAVRFKVNWKRSGILLIHSGIIIMMLGELVTGLVAVESHMTLAIGESANYVEDTRENEVAVIDRSDPKVDRVVSIPERLLRRGGRIQHEDLPFDIVVDEYMVNAVDPKRPLTEGLPDLKSEARAVPEVSGTSEGSDVPAARLSLYRKGTDEKLDERVVWLMFNRNIRRRMYPRENQDLPQVVEVDGKRYELFLRWRRVYKPYTLHLEKFDHKKYIGTETPKDFRSHVHLSDAGRGESRDVQIYMNHPLSYAGETFYQSGYLPGNMGTVLQVVDNPGWSLPYLSCGLVTLGMLIHFGLHLVQFLPKVAQ